MKLAGCLSERSLANRPSPACCIQLYRYLIMDIKYISDARGNITGVFIDIAEWQRLQKQYGISEAPPADSGAQLQQQLVAALKKAKPGEQAS